MGRDYISRLLLCVLFAIAASTTGLKADDGAWNDIREEVFGKREISPIRKGFKMYVEGSAKDASIVPISFRIPSNMVDKTKSLHVLIDRNPAPIAAVFKFGDGYRDGVNIGERKIDARIRIDNFSKVRAIFETVDGDLYMAEKFVAGAGGCSAVGAKDPEQALAQLGRIRVKLNKHPALGQEWREAVVMVRHPNFTGMQMDPKTGDYTPAWFVERVEVKRAGKLMMSVDTGISISEDPNLRFTFGSGELGDKLNVKATDTKGSNFYGESAPTG